MHKKNKKSLAIDVSDFSVEVIELEKQSEKIIINASNRALLEAGIVEKGIVRDKDKLRAIIENLLKNAKPRSIIKQNIIFSLPDNHQVYTNIFRVPIAGGKGIKQAVLNEIKNNIPLSFNEITYTYKVIKEETKNSEKQNFLVILIVVQKSYLLLWNSFFESIGLQVAYFETEALSLFRGMQSTHPNKPVGFLDIGASKSYFSIFSKSGIEYVFSSKIAGNLITESIAKEENITIKEAEKQKLSGKVSGSHSKFKEHVEKVLQALFTEVAETIAYYNNNSQENDVEQIFLTGGTSNIEDLVNIINKQDFNYQVELGLPIIKSSFVDRKYIQAIGSAIRGLDDKWEYSDPFLSLDNYEVENTSNITLTKLKYFFMVKEFLFPNHTKTPRFFIKFLNHLSKKTLIWVLVSFFVLIVLIAMIVGFKGHDEEETPVYSGTSLIERTDSVDSAKKEIPEVKKARGAEVKKTFVKINQFSGNLNVRSGPGVDFSTLTTVNSGAQFELIDEENGWYKIKIPNLENTWISSVYSKKLSDSSNLDAVLSK